MKIYLQRFSYPAVCVKLKSRSSKIFSNRRLEKAETLKTLLNITRDSPIDAAEPGPTQVPTHPPPIHSGKKTAASTDLLVKPERCTQEKEGFRHER